MSAALQILDQGSTVIQSGHGEALTLQPMNVAVTGYAQDLKSDPAESGIRKTRAPFQFHFAEDLITHIVWVRRSDPGLAGVTLKQVNTIAQAGTAKIYRAKHVEDDPNVSEVAFYCTMS